MRMPRGRILSFSSATFVWTPSSTRDGFWPRRISAKPSTTSFCSFQPTAPRRGVFDCTISATSPTITGVASRVLSTVRLMSSIALM